MEIDPNVKVSEEIVEEFAEKSGNKGQLFKGQQKLVMRRMRQKQPDLHTLSLVTGIEIIQRNGDHSSYGISNVVTYAAINRHLGQKQDQLIVPQEYALNVQKKSLDIFWDPMWNIPEWATRQLNFPEVPDFRNFLQQLKAHIPTIFEMLEGYNENAIKHDMIHFLPHSYRGVHDVFMSFYGLEKYLQSQR